MQEAVVTISKELLKASTIPVTIEVELTQDFIVGLEVVIDLYDPSHGQQEVQLITAILSTTQITVQKLPLR